MKKFAMIFCIVLLAGLGLLQLVLAQPPTRPQTTAPPPRARIPIQDNAEPVVLEGRVLDQDGNPIANAALNYGSEYLTDEQGNFRIEARGYNTRIEERYMLVIANSYAATYYPLSKEDRERPIEIRMAPGKEARVRVIDSSGNPIPYAHVFPHIIPLPGAPFRTFGLSYSFNSPFEKAMTADENGLWEFEISPEDKITCTFSSGEEWRGDRWNAKYMQSRNVILQTDGEIQEVVLPDCFTITGKPLDAETGELISNADIKLVSSPGQYVITAGGMVLFRKNDDGSYEQKVTEDYEEYAFLVSEEGYYPQTINFTKEGGDRTLDFHLKPDPGLSGTLMDTSGNPVRLNGSVTMIKAESMTKTLTNGGYNRSIPSFGERIEDYKNVDRNGNGRFTFDKSFEGEYHLLSTDSRLGFAVMSREEFEKNGNVIQLRPWGRVEVSVDPPRELEVELVPVEGQELPGVFPLVPGKNTQKASFNGKAVIDAMLPGAKYRVYGYANMSDGTIGSGRRLLVARLDEPVSVASGETVKITLPLVGRPVTMKPQFAGVENLLYPPDMPSNERSAFAQQNAITVELQRTDGKLTLPGTFNRSTGTVTFYTVEGGMYNLIFRVTKTSDGGQPSTTVYTSDRIPVITGDQESWSVETLDIGEVSLVVE